MTDPSSLLFSVAIVVEPPETTPTTTLELALEVPHISVTHVSTTVVDRARLAESTYDDFDWLDAQDFGFSSALVCSGILYNLNVDRLSVQYEARDETLPLKSVVSYFT